MDESSSKNVVKICQINLYNKSFKKSRRPCFSLDMQMIPFYLLMRPVFRLHWWTKNCERSKRRSCTAVTYHTLHEMISWEKKKKKKRAAAETADKGDPKSFMSKFVRRSLPHLEVVSPPTPSQPCCIMKRCCLPTELSHLIIILTLPTESWKGIMLRGVCLPYILHNQPPPCMDTFAPVHRNVSNSWMTCYKWAADAVHFCCNEDARLN